MENELFADSIGGITVTGSVVRVDLMTLSPTEKDEKNQPRPVLRQRLVMPVEGFVHSFGLMTQVMQQFEKSGLIKKAPAKGDKPTAEVKPNSPNFK
jgi:hypothetical protein